MIEYKNINNGQTATKYSDRYYVTSTGGEIQAWNIENSDVWQKISNKHSGWVNVGKYGETFVLGRIYPTEIECKKFRTLHTIDTIFIEWGE